MRADDPRVLAVAAALVGLVDVFATERHGDGGDELVAFPFGLERRAARGLMREGKLCVLRIGRKRYTTRRALAGLVTPAAVRAEAGEQVPTDATTAARKAYAAPLRVARGGRR